MNIKQLKAAIIEECQSDNFSIQKVHGLIEKNSLWESNEAFPYVLHLACVSCETTKKDVVSSSRSLFPVLARRLVCAYFREKGYPLSKIGGLFGIHHSTVIHGLEILKRDIEYEHPLTINSVNKFNDLVNKSKLL